MLFASVRVSFHKECLASYRKIARHRSDGFELSVGYLTVLCHLHRFVIGGGGADGDKGNYFL